MESCDCSSELNAFCASALAETAATFGVSLDELEGVEEINVKYSDDECDHPEWCPFCNGANAEDEDEDPAYDAETDTYFLDRNREPDYLTPEDPEFEETVKHIARIAMMLFRRGEAGKMMVSVSGNFGLPEFTFASRCDRSEWELMSELGGPVIVDTDDVEFESCTDGYDKSMLRKVRAACNESYWRTTLKS